MSSFLRRQLREDDAETVAELFVAGHGEARRMDGGEIRDWLANDALPKQNLLVLTRDDHPFAYFDLWYEPDGVVDADVAAPGAWAEAYYEAEQLGREAGANRIRTSIEDGHEAEPLLVERGYRRIRSSWTMALELGPEPPAQRAVDGIAIRTYRHPEDEVRVYETQEASFADHWGFHPQTLEQWRSFTVHTRDFEPSLWFLAWDGAEVAGFLETAYERPGDPGYGWAATLGVRREWRRRGIGEALLRHSFEALHARGQREIRLSVDAQNPTGATRLYERIGMHVLRTAHRWELVL